MSTGLVADIGGTNARFGWIAAPGSPVEHVRVLPENDHAGPVAAVRAYLQQLTPLLGRAALPPRAALAVVRQPPLLPPPRSGPPPRRDTR